MGKPNGATKCQFYLRRLGGYWGSNETLATRGKLGTPSWHDLNPHWAQKAGASLVISALWHLSQVKAEVPPSCMAAPTNEPWMVGGKQSEKVFFSPKGEF